ncbi:MAG: hypothetical protein GY716_13300 [bacterium]|nr:hypothetical protein [bacterium]
MFDHARRFALPAALAVGFSTAASAQIVPAQDFSSSGATWVESFCCERTIGWEFTIGNDVEVTSLGVYDRGAPGPNPGLGGAHEIAIWDLTGLVMSMSTVPVGTGGTANGEFRYQPVTPFNLPGGTNYKIAAFWPPANFDHYPDLNASGITPTYHPEVTFVQSAQLFGGTFGFPTVNSNNTFLAGSVNFLINDGGAPGPIGTNYCGPAVPNSSFQPGIISAVGVDFAGGLPLNIEATNLPMNQFGFFLASQNMAFFNPPGSQGFICLGNPIGRFNRPGEIMNSGTGGAFDLDVDTNDIPVSPPAAIMSGETWRFQAWFRDNNPNLTSNFTDGIEILFQ